MPERQGGSGNDTHTHRNDMHTHHTGPACSRSPVPAAGFQMPALHGACETSTCSTCSRAPAVAPHEARAPDSAVHQHAPGDQRDGTCVQVSRGGVGGHVVRGVRFPEGPPVGCLAVYVSMDGLFNSACLPDIRFLRPPQPVTQ